MNTNAVQIYAHVNQTRTETGQHCGFINKVALRLKSVMFLGTVFEWVKLAHSLLVERLPNTVKRLSLSLITALVCVLKAQASITSSKIMFLISNAILP